MTTPDRRSAVSPTETDLLHRFRCGDHGAFQSLLRPHLGSLRGLAARLARSGQDADDLVQETLVRAFQGLGGFRAEASLRTWLFRILVRLGSQPSRKLTPLPAIPQDQSWGEIPDSLGPMPDGQAIDRELRDRLSEALERLTDKQRLALHLRAVEGMGYRAIGESLDCKEAAARMHVLAARRKVRDRLERYLRP